MAWTELSDVRCYYELLGDGEPLLLIPGLATTCRLWDPATPLLSEHFCCIGFDNRGIGRSVARRHPHTLRDYSTNIVELLDALQLDRAQRLGRVVGRHHRAAICNRLSEARGQPDPDFMLPFLHALPEADVAAIGPRIATFQCGNVFANDGIAGDFSGIS